MYYFIFFVFVSNSIFVLMFNVVRKMGLNNKYGIPLGDYSFFNTLNHLMG